MAVRKEAHGHDAAGNRTAISGNVFANNDANHMNAVKRVGAAAERYGYSHRGERVLGRPEGRDAQIRCTTKRGTGWVTAQPWVKPSRPSRGVPELACIQPGHLGVPRVVIDSECCGRRRNACKRRMEIGRAR